MNNITPINRDGVTPVVIAQQIMEDAPRMDSIYVVGFAKTGEIWEYFSGTASEMCLAASIIQNRAITASFENRQ